MKNSIYVMAFCLLLMGCHGGYDVVPDKVAPAITVPEAITVAAVDASGTPATDVAITEFLNAASASDSVDGPVSVSNDAPSVFPLGATTVTFYAVDSAGNEVSRSVLVTVADMTPPILVLAGDITLQSSLVGGVEVTRSEIVDYLNAVSAQDNVDLTVDVVNNAPADFFPFGETIVEFVATDAAGNSASATGVVNVVLEVVLTDFNPATQLGQIHRLPAFAENDVLSTDLSVEPLNLLNLKNALVEGDFHTPTLNSRLYSLPVGSGSETAFISMFDGVDSIRDSGERHVMVELRFDWTSDGEQLDIVVPAQVMDILYTNQIDTVINLTAENYVLNSFSVTREGIVYPEILDDAFLRALAKFTDLPLDELLDAGTYTFQVQSSLPFTFVDGSTVTQIDAIVRIEADQ